MEVDSGKSGETRVGEPQGRLGNWEAPADNEV